MEELICESGNHKWQRKPTKGRKPRFCPKHKPIEVTQTTTVTLVCAHGNHEWERPRTKGKSPLYCPEHKPQIVPTTPKTEILICAFDGHEFTRIKRGRASAFCPEHKPQKAEKFINNPTVVKVPKIDVDNDLVSGILNGPDTELKRKLAYVVDEFCNPRSSRESGDWNSLHYTFNRLLEEAARALRSSVKINDLEMVNV
jgi:hypothetical protein